MTTHGQNIRVYTAWADGVGLRPGDRYLVINPMFHTFGYKAGLLACLHPGRDDHLAAGVRRRRGDPRSSRSERVTVLPGPPTLYASLLDHPARAGQDLSSLRLAVTGAAVVPVAAGRADARRAFPRGGHRLRPDGKLRHGDHRRPARRRRRPRAARWAGPSRAPRSSSAAPDGSPLPPGSSGEVLVRGYNVMRGYFEDPGATAAAIDPAGWLHTGDIGTLDADGNLRITDRLKDMFVVGGFNAYPAEIEQAITRHEKVSEAAVIGVPDARLGEVGRAFVVPRPGATVTEEEIIAFCRRAAGELQGPALGAGGHRAPPQRVRQGAQIRTPRPGGTREIVRSRHRGRRLSPRSSRTGWPPSAGPARRGGTWLRNTCLPPGLRASMVPSGWRMTYQPQR